MAIALGLHMGSQRPFTRIAQEQHKPARIAGSDEETRWISPLPPGEIKQYALMIFSKVWHPAFQNT